MPYIVNTTNRTVTVSGTGYKADANIPRYKTNDLDRVFVHYDKNKGINVPTENKLKVKE